MSVSVRVGPTAMRCLVLTACLLAAGCGKPALAPRDVFEAVFRHRLQKYAPDVTAYLSVDGKDPPAELLDRLREDWPNLKPASEDPKRMGLHVYASDLRWVGVAAVTKAGYWFRTEFAGEGYFADHHVVLNGGRWVVEKATSETIS